MSSAEPDHSRIASQSSPQNGSSTDVRVRNPTTSSGSEPSSSPRHQVGDETVVAGEGPRGLLDIGLVAMEIVARYSPAGHPSLLPTSWASVADSRSRPAPRTQRLALVGAQRELVDTQVEETSTCAESADEQGRVGPARERDRACLGARAR